MARLVVGTQAGVFERDGTQLVAVEGPADVRFLAQGARGLVALSTGGEVWERDGGGWRQVASGPAPAEVWSFGADPRIDGRLYLGVSPALLYRSDDGGRSWQACESVRAIPGYERWTFPPPPHIPHVRSVIADPSTPGAVLIGVEEGGVYRSPDGGETWQSRNEGLYWDVHTVRSSADGQWLLATTGGGVHRSEDGGQHWQRITDGLDHGYPVPLVLSPTDEHEVFTAAAAGPPPTWRNGGPHATLYRSQDGGRSWTRLSEGLPEPLDDMVTALCVGADHTVYAAAGSSVLASEDDGETWRTLQTDLPRVFSLALA